MSFAGTVTRGTPLVSWSWLRLQETVSATVTVDSRFGILVLFHANRPMNERTAARKGANDNQVWFSTNQKLIPLIVRDAIAVLWRARRSCDHRFAFADALGPSRTTTNKEATPPGTYISHCIRVRRTGFSWRAISSRRDCLLGPRARPISSGRCQEGSVEIVWR